MARRGKVQLVDGLASLRAAERFPPRERRYANQASAGESAPEKSASPSPASSPSPQSAVGKGIGRTVMPTCYEITCYACKYQFVMRGRAPHTQCPKCGARLGLKDETITGAFSDELTTAGKVTLTQSAILDGGVIIANDIILEGTVKSGTLQALSSLHLSKKAVIPEESIDARHLVIQPEAVFAIKRKLQLHNVDIAGELTADIEAEGGVTIHATGHLLGELKAQHLVVHEGAGLNANLRIEAAPSENEGGEQQSSDLSVELP